MHVAVQVKSRHDASFNRKEMRVFQERLPDIKIKSVDDLLDDLPFRGFAELAITLGEDQSLQKLNKCCIPCNHKKTKSNYRRF